MSEHEMQQLKDKYLAEFGDSGMKFMSFVLDQSMQLDLFKAALGAVINKDKEMSDQYLDAFGKVHAHLTGCMAEALKLSDDVAGHIFNSASEAYDLMRYKAETGESKTND